MEGSEFRRKMVYLSYYYHQPTTDEVWARLVDCDDDARRRNRKDVPIVVLLSIHPWEQQHQNKKGRRWKLVK